MENIKLKIEEINILREFQILLPENTERIKEKKIKF